MSTERKRDELTLDERGAWDRAWQRTYQQLKRKGETTAVARESAVAAGWRVVEAMRAGGEEPFMGRRRMPAKMRGMMSRVHTHATRSVSLPRDAYVAAYRQAEASGQSVEAWVAGAVMAYVDVSAVANAADSVPANLDKKRQTDATASALTDGDRELVRLVFDVGLARVETLLEHFVGTLGVDGGTTKLAEATRQATELAVRALKRQAAS